MNSDYFIDEKRPWLGGFKTGEYGDEATYFPELWTYLVKELGIKSVIDVGCGSGVATQFFETLLPFGDVLGIDGIPQEHPSIVEHDYTLGPFPVRERDLCWACEVTEHIEEKYVPNFLETFKCAQYVLMTHAFPGQQGWNHVNCQPPSYWIGCLAGIGYHLDVELTKKTMELAAMNESLYNHWVRSGMAFVRN